MQIKYKVSEVAKDFDKSSKDIVDILEQYDDKPKRSMATLESTELDVIFETLTQDSAVNSFDEYFAKVEEPEKVAEKAAPKAQEKKPEEKKDDSKAYSKKVEHKKVEEKPVSPAKTEMPKKDKVEVKKADNVKPEAPKTAASAPAKTEEADMFKAVNNQPVKKEKTEKTPQPQPRREARMVDTRTSQTDVGNKYDEKFDALAQASGHSGNKPTTKKQKINQRSKKRKMRSRKETESERLSRIAAERKSKAMTIKVAETITVGDLALKLKATTAEVIKKLMGLGIMASVNEEIDFDTAFLIAGEFHAKVEKEVVVTIEDQIIDDSDDTDDNLYPRDPIVVVMGHVDHGKTSILDFIRRTSVTAGEAGGITQHIGAYRAKVNDQFITFLDTPGHAAFTSMRARGAEVTDIAILVVAADDGIMPQTIEAINHARQAGVTIIVAINKMDKPAANPERIMQQLTEHGLVPEEWGGDVICAPVSAHTGEGMDKLLEMVLLEAEMMELKANPERSAKGTVIEAELDKGRGPVATILVQNGTLHIGDIVVAGESVGRVRAMNDENGNPIEEAGPSVPVEIMGLAIVPVSGDTFNAVSDEKLARELVEQRKATAKEERFGQYQKVTLDNLFDQLQEGEMKELNIIIKADVQGSVEAIRQSLEKLTNEEVRVRVIHGGVGAVSENDIMLAGTSNSIVVAFNVRSEPLAIDAAEKEEIDVRYYRVIYECIEEIEAAMKGMLAPKTREVEHGRIEVREVYKVSSVGTVAGSYVTDGKVTRSDLIRVVRDGIIVADDKMSSLRRFKDDVKEVSHGYECGITLEKFHDLRVGDVFEAYIIEEYRD